MNLLGFAGGYEFTVTYNLLVGLAAGLLEQRALPLAITSTKSLFFIF